MLLRLSPIGAKISPFAIPLNLFALLTFRSCVVFAWASASCSSSRVCCAAKLTSLVDQSSLLSADLAGRMKGKDPKAEREKEAKEAKEKEAKKKAAAKEKERDVSGKDEKKDKMDVDSEYVPSAEEHDQDDLTTLQEEEVSFCGLAVILLLGCDSRFVNPFAWLVA